MIDCLPAIANVDMVCFWSEVKFLFVIYRWNFILDVNNNASIYLLYCGKQIGDGLRSNRTIAMLKHDLLAYMKKKSWGWINEEVTDIW